MSCSQRPLTLYDMFPTYVRDAMSHALDCEVSSDEIPEGKKVIGTHSGAFHSDESLSVSLLRLLPEYKNYAVVRTRKQDVLEKCNIVVDVGGIYDHDQKRYDHHQKGFMEVFDENHKTKLSSAGLIWKHYGKEIIQNYCNHSLDDKTVSRLHLNLYDTFIEEIDGVDNGVDSYTGESNYKVTTTISSRVSRLYPSWNEVYSVSLELERFRMAMATMIGEFMQKIHELVHVILPARQILERAIDNAEKVHPSKSIIVLEKECYFLEHLYDVEKERGIEGQILFVIYEGKNNQWRIRAINVSPTSFVVRKQILPDCLGLRDEELSKKSGIDGCIFVHIAGFMGINSTKEGALEMARKSLYTCLLYDNLKVTRLSSFQFAVTTLNGKDIDTVVKDRELAFRFQCANKTIVYPNKINERDLLIQSKHLRDYVITLNAIKSQLLKEDVEVIFSLFQISKTSVFNVVWKISLAKLLFGPGEFILLCTETTENDVSYNLHFKNTSMRVMDYSVIIHSINLSSIPSGQYSYIFSSQKVDSVSSKHIEPHNGNLFFSIRQNQPLYLSECASISFSLQLYKKNEKTYIFTLPGSQLLTSMLLTINKFPLKSEISQLKASMVVEIQPEHVAPASPSFQLYDEGYTKENITITSLDVIPICIEESSLILPLTPLQLTISQTGYTIQKGSLTIIQIPFATIEKSTCSESKSIGYGLVIKTVYIRFNKPNQCISDWIRMKVTFREDHSIWLLFNTTPLIDEHRTLFYGKPINSLVGETPWIEVNSINGDKYYKNRSIGRLVTIIPQHYEKNITFNTIEELRPIELICSRRACSTPDNKNDAIFVQKVHSTSLRKELSIGYIVTAVLFANSQKAIFVNVKTIDKVIANLMKCDQYPLTITFANPYTIN